MPISVPKTRRYMSLRHLSYSAVRVWRALASRPSGRFAECVSEPRLLDMMGDAINRVFTTYDTPPPFIDLSLGTNKRPMCNAYCLA